MHKGYVKLWRKCLDNGMLRNHKLWVFWTWCLLKATHKTIYQTVGYKEVLLLPGQFIFGLNRAADETGLSIQNIRTCFSYLETNKQVTRKATNKFSVVTICNWSIYQPPESQTNSQDKSELTCSQQTTNKQVTTNKNIKNIRSTKKESIKKKAPEKPAAPLALPFLFEMIENKFTPEDLKAKDDFLSYWMEKKPNGRKERWEMEKVFDVNRRFRTWLKNNEQWDNRGYQKPKPKPQMLEREPDYYDREPDIILNNQEPEH